MYSSGFPLLTFIQILKKYMVRKILVARKPHNIWGNSSEISGKSFVFCFITMHYMTGCLPSQGSRGKVREFTISLEKSGKS